MTNSTSKPLAKVGDIIRFKSDVEQRAEVIEVKHGTGWRGDPQVSYIVKAPADGFDGDYISNLRTTEIYHDEIF